MEDDDSLNKMALNKLILISKTTKTDQITYIA